MKKAVAVLAVLAVVAAAVAFIPVGGDDGQEVGLTEPAPEMDLSEHSAEPPGEPIDLLFVHHSVGGALFADQGEASGEHAPQCIWETHPEGGGLRRMLTDAGYRVHEASYGSAVGERTDLFDWLPKFRDEMDRVLRVDVQDQTLEGDRRNRVVMFKSCFPNSDFVGEGEEPGDPAGAELTYWNARATMTALLEHLGAHPDVLFVYLTAPPLTAPHAEPLWRWGARRVLGRSLDAAEQRRRAALARRFNDWVRSPDGWLSGYPHRNVVVFDFFDVLTGDGASNFERYPTGGGTDAHPSREGNLRAARELLPLVNRAVRRAGLLEAPAPAEAAPGEAPAEAAQPDGGAPDGGSPAAAPDAAARAE